MKLHASGEDYLEAILMIQKEKGMARSVDVARHLGFSKPSVSHAVGILCEGGFLTVDGDGCAQVSSDRAFNFRLGNQHYWNGVSSNYPTDERNKITV